MRLYPKKLNSTAELMEEKRLLQTQVNVIDPDGTFSLKVDKTKTNAIPNASTKTTGNLLGSLLGFDAIDIFLKILPLFTGKGKKGTVEKKGPNPLVKAGFEFASGYLKWKAIELTYKGLKKLLAPRKKNA